MLNASFFTLSSATASWYAFISASEGPRSRVSESWVSSAKAKAVSGDAPGHGHETSVAASCPGDGRVFNVTAAVEATKPRHSKRDIFVSELGNDLWLLSLV